MKLNRPLSGIALLLATFLSVALAYLGTSKFYYLLAGGRKFPTFPSFYWQLGIGSSYLLLSILYVIWVWYHVDRVPPKATGRFSSLLLKASVFLGLAFISYPLGNDIYVYLHTGLMNLSGANPFLIRAAAFTTELSPYVDWGQTSTYGPFSQILFTVSSVFLFVHPLLAVYAFKAICLVFHVINAFLLWKWLPSEDQEKITSFYLLHPLLLVEQVGSAHIDILVSTSLILFALSFAKQRFWSAFAALWLGFLSKTLPILWAPLVALSFLRLGRWKLLIKMILASGAIALVLSVLALPDVNAWRSLLNPGVAGQMQSSLHAIARFGLDLVRIFLPDWITPAESGEVLVTLNQMTLLGFLCFYAWRLWRSDRHWKTTPRTLIEEMGWITLVLMLFATPWLMPWYCTVPLTFAALIPRARLFGITSLAFGLSSSAQYLLLNNSSIKSLVSIGLPIAAFLVGLWFLNRHRMAEEVALSEQLATSRSQSSPRIENRG